MDSSQQTRQPSDAMWMFLHELSAHQKRLNYLKSKRDKVVRMLIVVKLGWCRCSHCCPELEGVLPVPKDLCEEKLASITAQVSQIRNDAWHGLDITAKLDELETECMELICNIGSSQDQLKPGSDLWSGKLEPSRSADSNEFKRRVWRRLVLVSEEMERAATYLAEKTKKGHEIGLMPASAEKAEDNKEAKTEEDDGTEVEECIEVEEGAEVEDVDEAEKDVGAGEDVEAEKDAATEEDVEAEEEIEGEEGAEVDDVEGEENVEGEEDAEAGEGAENEAAVNIKEVKTTEGASVGLEEEDFIIEDAELIERSDIEAESSNQASTGFWASIRAMFSSLYLGSSAAKRPWIY